jgi:predicted nucleotidyltransferase
MRHSDIVTDNVAYHSKLNPLVWNGDELKLEVKVSLLRAAKFFVESLEIPNFRVIDIVLTGSMANYNYTRHSDFDLHVVTRYSDLECDDLAEAFYRAKKSIWNDAHNIMIAEHEVELYVEDIEQPPVSAGMYSLLQDRWIKTPDYQPPTINDSAIKLKVQDLVKQIDVAVDRADDPNDIKRIIDKIRKMRRSGLDSEGEFGVENLTFKILRNLGYIDKLTSEFHYQQDQAISI